VSAGAGLQRVDILAQSRLETETRQLLCKRRMRRHLDRMDFIIRDELWSYLPFAL